jgi:sulfide:quinone oxidoreductase
VNGCCGGAATPGKHHKHSKPATVISGNRRIVELQQCVSSKETYTRPALAGNRGRRFGDAACARRRNGAMLGTRFSDPAWSEIMDVHKLTDTLSVAQQISASDVAEAVRLGFRTVINNRPDDEAPGQPASADIAAAAERAGVAYYYQPVVSGGLCVDDVVAFRELLGQVEGPALAFCRTGTRCTHLWALSQAGSTDADRIIATAARAGYDVSGMRHLLEHKL